MGKVKKPRPSKRVSNGASKSNISLNSSSKNTGVQMGDQILFNNLAGMFASADLFFYIMTGTTCIEIGWNAYSGETGNFNLGIFVAIIVATFVIYMFVVSRAAPYFVSNIETKSRLKIHNTLIGITIPFGKKKVKLSVPAEFLGYFSVLSLLAYFQLRGQYLMLGVEQSLFITIILFMDNLVNNLYACILPARTTGRLRVFCHLYLQHPATTGVLFLHFTLVIFTFLGSLSVFYPTRGSLTVGLEFVNWIWDVLHNNPTIIRWPVIVFTFASLLTNNIARLIGDANLWREILKRNDGFDISFLLPLYAFSNVIPAVLLGIQFGFIPTQIQSYGIIFVMVLATFYLAKFLANKVFKHSPLLAILCPALLAFGGTLSLPWITQDRFSIIVTLVLVTLTSIIEIAVHDLTDNSMSTLNSLDSEPPNFS